MTGRPPRHVAVIGAGIAGLSAAAELVRAGLRASVFEKSRGVGGRLATRRPFRADADAARARLTLDHGAPAAHGLDGDPAFAFPPGAVAPWSSAPDPLDGAKGAEAWVAADGAAAVAAAIAQASGATVRPSTTVIDIARGDEDFLLRAEEETAPIGPFDAVISAIPPDQARALLDGVTPAAEFDAEMRPVATVMLVAPRIAALAEAPAFIAPADGPIEKVFRESAKPGRAAPWPEALDGWVAHADQTWSEAAMSSSKEEIADALSAELWRALGVAAAAPRYLAGHRWRYAYATRPVGRAFWLSDDGRLAVCGDWRLGARVGDARRSGVMLGRRMAAALAR